MLSGDEPKPESCQTAEALARSSVPILGIGQDQRITICNPEAERLLGVTDVVGRRCFEELRGEDAFGNAYCGPHCPIVRTVASGEAPRPFVLRLQTACGMRPVRLLPLSLGSSEAVECHAYVLVPLDHELSTEHAGCP